MIQSSIRSLWLVRSASLLLFLAVAVQQPVSAQDVAAQERAAEALQSGDCSRALDILEATMSVPSRDARALLLRARTHECLGNRDRAGSDFGAVLELDPANTMARQGRDRLARRTEDQEAGTTDLQSAVAADPTNAGLRLRLAEALYEAGAMKKAAAAYTAWLDLPGIQGTPDIIERYLVSVAGYDGDNALGERVADRYTKIFPNNDDLWMRLGYFRLWQAKYTSATAACEQALRLNPGNESADVCLRQVDEQQAAARAAAHQAGQTAGAGPSVFVVDRLYRDLKRDPNNDDKRFQLVEQLLKYRRYQEAYDQLNVLEARHGDERRWLALFVDADNGFIESRGVSPIYAIDRLTYRLRFDPEDDDLRYVLVQELADADRTAEAIEILTDPVYGSPSHARYASLLSQLVETRAEQNRSRIVDLEGMLRQDAGDVLALRELAELYQVEGRTDQAVAVLGALLDLDPSSAPNRARYAEALRSAGNHDDAYTEARRLIATQPGNPEYQRIFVLASIATGRLDEQGERFADELSRTAADDTGLLLDLAQFRLGQGNLEGAETLIRRASANGDTRFAVQLEAAGHRLDRERIRQEDSRQFELLAHARSLAADQAYNEAVAAYERYFEARGGRSRAEMKELAQVHTANRQFVAALSVLQALDNQAWEYDVAKEIARNQMYREDYSGAIRTLERLNEKNPQDYEVRFMQADAFRELGLFAQAQQIVDEAEGLSGTSRSVNRQTIDLDASLRTSLAASGYDSGFDYVGLIVPTTDAVIARGGGTKYNRWMQGAQTHVTLPIGRGAVLMAGVNSHFLEGTRLLRNGSPETRGRINQVLGAGYLELTPKLAELNHASYTNRLSIEGGLYDYEGGRTVGFGGIRYWRQDPGIYRGSIGVHTGEGSLDLWSPAGGEYDLRNTQLDIQAFLPNVMPDSTLRISGYLAVHSVSDDFGSLGSSTESNTGTTSRLEGSYKVLGHTWLGVTWYNVSWRTTTDLYWSPRDYSSWDLFLEYEKNTPFRWYVRLRGAIGMISRSSGFIARRVELDLIRRLSTRFSLNVVGAMGQSTRTLGSGPASYFDRYNTFSLSATLYWTL